MSSFGAIADMLLRLENNKKLLSHQRSYYRVMENYTKMGKNKPIEWRKLNQKEKEELAVILERRVREERKKDIRAAIVSLFISAMILAVLAALFRWLWM